MHLFSGALEEHTAAADEERVPREDRACAAWGRRRVGHVVADRVARVTRRRETPGYTYIYSRELSRVGEREKGERRTSRRALYRR